MTPAKKIIEKFGGPKQVAEIIGVSVTQVYRFTYPRDKGGTGGLIPADHMRTLRTEAEKRGLVLDLDDFLGAA